MIVFLCIFAIHIFQIAICLVKPTILHIIPKLWLKQMIDLIFSGKIL